jgi:hypothetical protein
MARLTDLTFDAATQQRSRVGSPTDKSTSHLSVAENVAIDSSLIDQAVGAELGRDDSIV